MYCPQCKTPNPVYNTKCSKCGSDLPKQKAEPMSPGIILGLSIAGFVLAAIIGFIVVRNVVTQSSRGTGGGLGGAVMLVYFSIRGVKKYRQAKVGGNLEN